ncbi:MAG: hypothetical protein AAF152_00905 [Cyanobacteria bacterium P01_A01_bin.114]
MSQPLYNELMKQAKQLTAAEQLRLAEHLEWMATRSHLRELSALLGRKVDVVIADSLPDEIRQGILNEAIAV